MSMTTMFGRRPLPCSQYDRQNDRMRERRITLLRQLRRINKLIIYVTCVSLFPAGTATSSRLIVAEVQGHFVSGLMHLFVSFMRRKTKTFVYLCYLYICLNSVFSSILFLVSDDDKYLFADFLN